MKKKAPLTLSSREDHQRRFPGSPDGSWWQDADRDRFTARAESELPRMRLAKFGPSFQTFSEASLKRHAARRSQVEEI